MIAKICLVFACVYTAYAVIPPYIHICQKNNSNIAECIIKSVNNLRDKLKTGIPELGVPSLEPLPLDEIKLRSGPASAKIDANITNIKVWGPTSFKIIDLRPNLAKNRFQFRSTIPLMHFEGDYDIDMNLLLLKYKGIGPITGNFTDFTFECVLKGRKVNINGNQHLKFDKMRLHLTIGKSVIRLGNLFRDDPVIAEATRSVVEDNSDLFMQEIRPVLENALAEKFTDIANKVTLKFTYQELFP